MKKILCMAILFCVLLAKANLLIDPAGNGGFESGTDFAANGWTVVNGTQVNPWQVGTASFNSGSKAVYISNDGGSTNA